MPKKGHRRHAMVRTISVRQLRNAIKLLPADRPKNTPGKWYRTQKEHWLGWLREYDGPGFYGRTSRVKRDARFAYNHIVESKMLLWVIRAAGVPSRRLAEARRDERNARSMQAKSSAVRKSVPWEILAPRLWPDRFESS